MCSISGIVVKYHYESSVGRIAFQFSEASLAAPKTVNPAPRKCVVIVDDDKSYGILLLQLLSDNLDCPVVVFSSPRAALAALPTLDPGVIVTDYDMPGLTGFELMERAAGLVPGVPFILITGNPIDEAMERLVAASPVKAVVPKPFHWQKLAEEISRHWPESGVALLKAGSASL